MTQRPEFEEIAHMGGTIAAIVDEQGTALQISHSAPTPAVLVPVCVSFEGKVVGFPPVVGLGDVSRCPGGSTELMLLSDCEGMFGQRCRACNSYFRNGTTHSNWCPYCAKRSPSIRFLTSNQLKFLASMFNLLVDADNDKKSREVSIGALVDALPENRQGWVYSEERLQAEYSCSQCKNRYDILGNYGLCPTCGKPNFNEVFNEKLDALAAEFRHANETIKERIEREIEWGKLTTCISELDALFGKVKMLLQRLPNTPARRAAIGLVSIHNVRSVREKLIHWYDIDIFEGLPATDVDFLNKMVNRRHIFTHKGGQVDQEYLDNTGDTTVKLHEVIRFRSNEIKRLIPIVRGCGNRLLEGLNSIS